MIPDGFTDYAWDEKPLVASDHAHGHNEAMCYDRAEGWVCTRVDGHSGRHEAGLSSGDIRASWPGDDE